MTNNKIFMEYNKSDIINFLLLMLIALVLIPITVKSGYWYSSILIPWLCLALASIGQQIVMGYAHKNNTCGMSGNMSCVRVNLGDIDGNGSDDFISEEINFCDFR